MFLKGVPSGVDTVSDSTVFPEGIASGIDSVGDRCLREGSLRAGKWLDIVSSTFPGVPSGGSF